MMVMMINGGDATPHSNPTVRVPPWDGYLCDPTASNNATNHTAMPFPLTPKGCAEICSFESLAAFNRYLPSNNATSDGATENDDLDIPVDAFSCDAFRIYEFKVLKCTRGRSHDWTECPFAHPGEKARRRDPRKYHYSGNSCPEFRNGHCVKGDACEFAHGVFECWLHPARYRTQPCKDGTHCKRRVCFFAHTPDQLRVLPVTESDDFPDRLGRDLFLTRSGHQSPPSSPLSEWTDSPPVSPSWNSVSGLAESMRGLQIGKAPRMGMAIGMGMGMSMSPPAWGCKMGFGSPRSPVPARPGFKSVPTTPTRAPARSGFVFDLWDQGSCGEEPVMERVESGRGLRAKIYAKLSKENSLDSTSPGPDVEWVSELVN